VLGKEGLSHWPLREAAAAKATTMNFEYLHAAHSQAALLVGLPGWHLPGHHTHRVRHASMERMCGLITSAFKAGGDIKRMACDCAQRAGQCSKVIRTSRETTVATSCSRTRYDVAVQFQYAHLRIENVHVQTVSLQQMPVPAERK
jgi:hypothetical protein